MPICHNDKTDDKWTQDDFNSFKLFAKKNLKESGSCPQTDMLMACVQIVYQRRADLD